MPDPSDKKEGALQSAQEAEKLRRIRRYIIAGGSLGTGAALIPSAWTRPVVQSVILPAHAQTSAVPFDGTGLVGGDQLGQNADPNGFDFAEFVQRVRSAVISDAHAMPVAPPTFFCISIFVANLLDNGSSTSCTLNSNQFGTDQGNGTLGDLLSGGITTGGGFNVVANDLDPGGGGSGTVDGTPFMLTGGSCTPLDDGGESPSD